MDNHTGFDFRGNIRDALGNSQLRKNLKFAMTALAEKRRAIFTDKARFEEMRTTVNAIRKRSLSKLPELLDRLEKKCTENGIIVHWAETTAEANDTVLSIVKQHGATAVVKGKSMVSEEMHLNRFLLGNQVEPIETDLGEFIIQLADETPSHIIVPAIHKNRGEVGKLFSEKIPGTPYTDVPEELTEIARAELRRKYYETPVGISGVNMAVAETGTLCLVENEGNGRMCTTAPDVHIAIMGLEKVVENLTDVPPILRLLTGSATGQLITTYFNMITSPRKAGEKDGPKEVHLVILDNGRSDILADPELRQTLLCIRCGTCLNHCPVYVRIGGHAYHYTYPGPIGEILTPQMEGLETAGTLTTASSLCNACSEVCPAMIPIPDLIRRLRNESYDTGGSVKGHGYKANPLEKVIWKGWELVNRHPGLNALSTKMAGVFGPVLPKAGPLKAWTRVRNRPTFAKKSLHELVKEEGVSDE
ncbi:iron-sulfur cluster-binding protein [Desulfonema ishimotonii]|uniref:Iron-sulfur cluster-binding protein n=1 Tax=Desulfonema ishimotonii TaxID=45657 RepID=A0A401FW02_9BACT|nr:LutB/LldF family L-lactate oxidation iron-sulfur protein [Desulfonema ishimotonii]GBC61145.1 iron-sulfur cluster-binding protein [Desulfonema ishimotonii]